MYLTGTFAIYPTVDAINACNHAVIFCDDAEIAKRLCDYLTTHTGTHHSAILRMTDWPDPKLIHNLNGCEHVSFSVRDSRAADRASWACREILGPDA